MLLKNEIVIVSGGGGLLGSKFVEGIAREGGVAVIADISDPKLTETDSDYFNSRNSKNVDFVHLDITNAESIDFAIQSIFKKYGKIDALVNSAYPRNEKYGAEIMSVQYDDFCENVNIHLGGYFQTCQRFTKYFVSQGYGNIINIASIYGLITPRFEIYEDTTMTTPIEYAVTKAGVIQMTRYLAKYLKGKNIRVNSLSPGGVSNNQPKLFANAYGEYCLNKGMLDGQDVVGTLVFLLSNMSKYINGQNIIVDDGFTL